MQSNLIIKKGAWLLLALVALSSCKSDYQKLVERETASGERQDSLFLGLRLGMSSKEFYSQCWELNKKQLVRQGYTNTSVLLRLNQELRDTADMNFYPTFVNDTIYDMQVHIGYPAWSPWNQRLNTDTLVVDVVRMLNRWYGGDFVKASLKDTIPIYVKVNKNRRIMVSREDEARVRVIYTDLYAEKRKLPQGDGKE